MADIPLSAAGGTTKSDELNQLGAEIQVQASRIRSLAEAIDNDTDGVPDTAALGRVLDYVNLLREAADKVSAKGEQVELLALKNRITRQ
jgi:hypothetical protein